MHSRKDINVVITNILIHSNLCSLVIFILLHVPKLQPQRITMPTHTPNHHRAKRVNMPRPRVQHKAHRPRRPLPCRRKKSTLQPRCHPALLCRHLIHPCRPKHHHALARAGIVPVLRRRVQVHHELAGIDVAHRKAPLQMELQAAACARGQTRRRLRVARSDGVVRGACQKNGPAQVVGGIEQRVKGSHPVSELRDAGQVGGTEVQFLRHGRGRGDEGVLKGRGVDTAKGLGHGLRPA